MELLSDLELTTDLKRALDDLEKAIAALNAGLQDGQRYPIWVWTGHQPDPPSAPTPFGAVRETIGAIRYLQHQGGRTSRICPALVGVSRNTLHAADALNIAKARLREAMKRMDGRLADITNADGTVVLGTEPLLKAALYNANYANLHRRQALRQLVVLHEPPTSVSFVWAQPRKSRQVTAGDLIAQIERRIAAEGNPPSPNEKLDLEYLAKLPKDEPLAVTKRSHLHPRVNLVGRHSDQRTWRIQRQAVLPILYPSEPGAPLPRLRPLPLEKPEHLDREQPSTHTASGRRARNDAEILPKRVLKTIDAHHYRDPRAARERKEQLRDRQRASWHHSNM